MKEVYILYGPPLLMVGHYVNNIDLKEPITVEYVYIDLKELISVGCVGSVYAIWTAIVHGKSLCKYINLNEPIIVEYVGGVCVIWTTIVHGLTFCKYIDLKELCRMCMWELFKR